MFLPAMARRHYQDAQAAFDAGDFSRAMTEGERAMRAAQQSWRSGHRREADAILSEVLESPRARFRRPHRGGGEGLHDCRSQRDAPAAVGASTVEASILASAPRLTGRLEILVGRSGRVEAVKLDTPGTAITIECSSVPSKRGGTSLRSGTARPSVFQPGDVAQASRPVTGAWPARAEPRRARSHARNGWTSCRITPGPTSSVTPSGTRHNPGTSYVPKARSKRRIL